MKSVLYVLALSIALSACGKKTQESRLFEGEEFADLYTPDLLISFGGDYQIHGNSLTYTLKFKNAGLPMEEEVDVATKVVLVPRDDYARKLVGQGFVLETVRTPLNLGNEEEVLVTYTSPLPDLPRANYYLGATTNTRFSALTKDGEEYLPGIGEGDNDSDARPIRDFAEGETPAELGIVNESFAAQMNNVTEQMLDLGEVEVVSSCPAPSGPYDLYHEVQAATFSFTSGTAGHSSRNILRVMDGASEVPDNETWNDDISARFLFFNLKAGTMYMGAYTSHDIDKVWFAISWNEESDRQGRDIFVDYYHNAPIVSGLQPGEYLLGVLMNVNDRFALDSFPANNLDLTYMNLEASNAITVAKDLWMNVNGSGEANALYASIHDTAEDYEWSYSIDQQPDWLSIEENNYGYQYALSFQPDPVLTPIGTHEFEVTITAIKGGETFSSTSHVYVSKVDGPIMVLDGISDNMILTPDSPGAEIVDRGAYHVFRYSFQVTNVGNRDLIYNLAEAGSTTVELPADRRLAPGTSQTISLSVPLVGLQIPREEADFVTHGVYVSFTSNGGMRSAYVSLNVPTDDLKVTKKLASR